VTIPVGPYQPSAYAALDGAVILPEFTPSVTAVVYVDGLVGPLYLERGQDVQRFSWWRRQFPDPAKAPARLTFQAGALPFGAKIELQAVAARGR
jgi:hypothetical protein